MVKIYQADINTPYVFMSYEFAKANNFDMNDYKEVASFEIDGSYSDICEYVWDIGNNGTLQKSYKMRSVSVSDIIDIDGHKFYVDSFGFAEI